MMRSNTPKLVGTVAVAVGLAALAGGVMVDFSQTAKPAEPVNIDKLRASYKRPNFIPFPKDNPYTFQKVELGKRLYFDSRLSEPCLLSCASCHNPAYTWADGLPKGIGHMMKELGRRSPTIVNAAWGQIFMWDGRMATLEQQAQGIDQVNQALNQLDEVTQQNSALVEENAATAKTLDHQATDMSERVGFFKLEGEASDPAEAPLHQAA